jgi:glycerol kinase
MPNKTQLILAKKWMKKYIMALDQGTTSSRCILFDKKGNLVSSATKEFRQIYPKEGWVEHDPMDIWSTQIGVAQEALLKINGSYKDIQGIGITNQRETTLVWEKSTGNPVYNGIVWQCRRTSDICKELKNQGLEPLIQEKTGLLIDPYFSATKIQWILENVEGAKEKAKNGQLLFGTVETWLIWKMSGGKLHITDYTNASRTMLFNINTLAWDEEILEILGIPALMLPKPVSSSSVYGQTDPVIFGGPIPIAGAAGDQQAALFGQCCFKTGELKSTYGTGGFLLMNVGEKPVFSKNGLLTTIAFDLNGKIYYALEGSIFVAGAAVQWLRDELRVIDSAEDSAYMASKVEDTGGVYVVPAFVGLGAPHWNPYARGMVVGLTRGTSKNHLVRATLESIAYQNYDLLKVMEKDSGKEAPYFRVDGGASANDFLMQFQANLLGIPVERPASIETTALGAAYLAGLATGFWKDEDELLDLQKIEGRYSPDLPRDQVAQLLKGWNRAVKSAIYWAEEE